MSSSDGAAASAAADGAAPARPGLGARLATLAERFRLPPATRLSLVILLTVFALVRASPDSTAHLALVPAHTVPRVWNVVTSSWVEPTPPGVAVAAAALVALGRAVEPGMGARETARFLLFVSAFVGACAFALSLARFHLLGGDEKALYDAHCGFQGIVAGLLVVCKRDAPDAPVNARGLRWMRREQLCGVHLLLTAALGLATGRVLSTFGFAAFGLYGAWVYLRHVQLHALQGAGHGVGDPSDRMDLVTFLPRRAAPLLAPALDAAHEALCGRRQRRLAAAYGVGSLHAGLAKHADTKPGVTTDDAAEAQRRRERGAKALAERLALKAKREKTPAPSFRGDPDPLADATSASDAATRAEGDVAEAV
jgi:membrane associated rhomboid family serine protease